MEIFLILAAVVVVGAVLLFVLGMCIRAGRADDDMDRWFDRVFHGGKGGDHAKKVEEPRQIPGHQV